MPYTKVKSGKNKGKYKRGDRYYTLKQVQAIHINKKKRKK